MKNFIRKWYPLLIILAVAAILRTVSLFTRGTFWFDESFSIHFSTLASWAETWKYWTLETNPPLYTFFLRFYLPFINQNNEILVRLPSLIFGLFTIILLYILAEKMLSKRAAIISSTLLAFSSLHIFASVETRVYSLLTLLVTTSFFVLYKIIFEQTEGKKIWLIYAVLNILLIFSHLTALPIILIQFFVIQFSGTKKETVKYWFFCQFISFALWSVWFIPAAISKLNLNLGNSWFFENPGNLMGLLLYPLLNATDNNLFNTLCIIFIFICLYIFVTMIKEAKDTPKRNTLLLIATWAFLPLILSSIVGSFTVKYIIISYPAIFILIASVLEKYIINTKRFLVFIAFIFLVFAPPTFRLISQPVFSWKPINDFLAKNETDKSIIIIPFIQELDFKPQYSGKIPVISLYLKEDNLSLEEKIVRYNWQTQNTGKKELYDWIVAKIQKDNINKIFILNQGDNLKMIGDILIENQWTLTAESSQAGLKFHIIEFDAPNN